MPDQGTPDLNGSQTPSNQENGGPDLNQENSGNGNGSNNGTSPSQPQQNNGNNQNSCGSNMLQQAWNWVIFKPLRIFIATLVLIFTLAIGSGVAYWQETPVDSSTSLLPNIATVHKIKKSFDLGSEAGVKATVHYIKNEVGWWDRMRNDFEVRIEKPQRK